MKRIDTLIQTVIILSFVVLLYYFILYYPFAFNFELNNNGQYLSVFIGLTCWLIFLFLALFSTKGITPHQCVVMLLVSILVSPIVFSSNYTFSNEYYINVFVVMIFYGILLSSDLRVSHFILLLLMAIFFWQLYISLQQLQSVSSIMGRMSTQGTFRNSGVFSSYLVIHLPIVYYLFFDAPKSYLPIPKIFLRNLTGLTRYRIRVVLFSLVLCLVIFLIWHAQSRTAIISLLTTPFFFLLLNKKNLIRNFYQKVPISIRFAAILFLLVVLGFGFHYLFYLKKMSAIGRVMALNISIDHIADHLWSGTGLGRFTWFYPQWQAQYFDAHPNPSKDYFLSAGETYILFNEYIQLFQTIGLLGFIGFVWFLHRFFNLKSETNKSLLNTVKLTVITILLCGLSSYPFHVNQFLLLLVLCFSIAEKISIANNDLTTFQRVTGYHLKKYFLFGLIGIAFLGWGPAFKHWLAKRDWDELRNRLDDPPAAIKDEYGRLVKALGNDGKFLTEYGIFLSEIGGNGQDASKILERAKMHFTSKTTIETLGQVYRQKGDYKNAIQTYKWLCSFIPNRFGTKLDLLNLYIASGDSLSARQIGQVIMTMPVKIPSPQVDRIKAEADRILNHMQ